MGCIKAGFLESLSWSIPISNHTKLEFDEKIHVWLYCPSTAPASLIALANAAGATRLAEPSGIALKLLRLISPYSSVKPGATHLKAVSVTALFMASGGLIHA